MKKVIRENILTAYSLHDMNIISVDIVGNDIILRTQSGLVETVFPYGQPDGYVEFQNVRWDYSFVYLLGVTGNVGTFTGEKMFLKDFISRFTPFGFSVMDETYGHSRPIRWPSGGGGLPRSHNRRPHGDGPGRAGLRRRS